MGYKKERDEISQRLYEVADEIEYKMRDDIFDAVFNNEHSYIDLIEHLETIVYKASGKSTYTLKKVLDLVDKFYSVYDVPSLIVWEFNTHIDMRYSFENFIEAIPNTDGVRISKSGGFVEFLMKNNVVRVLFRHSFEYGSEGDIHPYMFGWDNVVILKDHTMFRSPYYWNLSKFKDGKVIKERRNKDE